MRKNKEKIMIIHTKFDEELEIKETDVISFNTGIPGFEEEREFVLLPIEDTAFSLLQSLNTKELGFFTADPFVFYPEYDFDLSVSEAEKLEINEPKDVLVQAILTAADPFQHSTINLQAPLIINLKNQNGKQVVLTNTPYTTRQSITKEEV
ncbi:flagellar assembly protein FliW [Fictibacillus iocasae]|uniref:Flagellar assembly factor FliW n=1 Tax=Fictibacillus iocasae TaxID=2715437 RepID=A0ABW2NVQ6_9BACL